MENPMPEPSTKKNHDIPIDHFDFKYVEACNDVKELEKIYKILLFVLIFCII